MIMMTLGCYFLMRDFSSKRIQKKYKKKHKKTKNIKKTQNIFYYYFQKLQKLQNSLSLFFVFVFHLGDFLFQPFDFIARLLDVG